MDHIFWRHRAQATSVTTPVVVPADPARACVEDNPSHSRFDLWVDGELVGILGYRAADGVTELPGGVAVLTDGDVIALMHTVITEDFGGRGWAAVLVREVLEEVRVRGVRIRPVCTYLRRYLGTHPEYLPLLDDGLGELD